MLRCSVWLAVASLVLCVTSSARAQANLTQGKTLYSSECEQCHKVPQNVIVFHGGIDLQTFLGEQHHASTPETAAAIAAYLRGLQKLPLPRRRPPQGHQAGRPLTETAEQTSAENPVQRALNTLLGTTETGVTDPHAFLSR